MSVINQMLKDLEERKPESSHAPSQQRMVAARHSSAKVAVFTALLVLVICSMSFYVWQINSENNALKAEQQARELSLVSQVNSAEENKSTLTSTKIPTKIIPTKIIATKIIENSIVKDSADLVVNSAAITEPVSTAQVIKTQVIKAQVIDAPLVVESKITKVEPAIKAAKLKTRVNKTPSANSIKRDIKTVSSNKQMSVSRRQLSADELAQQKLALAEKALNANQITKAEKLLEDVIIIKPSDSQTRKKLAALWFGRQAYQDAVNLLSQGISLDRNDSSFRQMKARIHLKQGQATAALNTLKPLALLKDEQYQIMLANTAQQAGQNNVAVSAYKVLITMQPDIGRWQLGLAVLYDKNSQFNLASKAYKNALTKRDLSVSSADFVKQRIQVIGQ